MDEFELIKPDISHLDDIRSFRQEIRDTGGSMDGTGFLKRIEDLSEWLSLTQNIENPETVPEGCVEGEQFIYVRKTDNKVVGLINFRHYLNDTLIWYGGHIGYSVRIGERKKGYGKSMLAECLKICRAFGLDRVLITCNPDNEGSRRTILANGGTYENTVFCEENGEFFERYWIEL